MSSIEDFLAWIENDSRNLSMMLAIIKKPNQRLAEFKYYVALTENRYPDFNFNRETKNEKN